MNKKVRTLRGAMATLLTSSMLIGSMGLGFAAGFSDIENHWAQKQINNWVNRGTVSGYQDGTFKPDAPITRAEFVALVNKVYRYQAVYDVDYTDVSSSDWYYEDFRKAKAQGYINGYADKTIKPNNKITRQEVAVIMSKILHAENNPKEEVANQFKDADKIASWSKGSVGSVVNFKYMKGYPDGTFKPENHITRAEAIATLDKAFNTGTASSVLVEEKDTSSSSSSSSKDDKNKEDDKTITKSGYTLEDKTIKGDLIISNDVKDGDVTLKNVTVKGTTKIYGGGENSIHIKDCDLKDIVIDKKDDKIRVVLEGKTTVGKTEVKSGAILEEKDLKKDGFEDVKIVDGVKGEKVTLKGDFDQVDIEADGGKIYLEEGSVNRLETTSKSKDTKIDMDKDAKVSKLVLSAETDVTGKGKIEAAYIKSKGSTIEQEVDGKVDVDKNCYATINGKKITESMETEKDTKAPEFKSSYPQIDNEKEKSAELSVKLNEAGKVYYIVVEEKASKPTVSQVKAGKDYIGGNIVAKGTIKVDKADKEENITLSSLDANTSYKVYCVAEDTAKEINTQKSVTSVSFKTIEVKVEKKEEDKKEAVKAEAKEEVKVESETKK